MRTIDKDTLNTFLADSNIPYKAIEKLPTSGQREVYSSIGLHDNQRYVVKVAHYCKYNVSRIEREIRVLNSINSSYFPSIVLETFVANEVLSQYFENIITAEKTLSAEHIEFKDELRAEVDAFHSNPIRPFYLTVENYVENIPWKEYKKTADEVDILNLIKHCLVALDILWSNKIAHRDLKPDNILIRPDKTPVIIDLGIAKSFNEGTVDLTPGFMATPGTYRYASPEQLMDKKGEITYKSDQFSTGIVAYELLCGQFPFGDMLNIGPEGVVERMMAFDYTPINEAGGNCCEEFENFIKKLLQPEPHQRFRTSKKIFQQLETIQGVLR